MSGLFSYIFALLTTGEVVKLTTDNFDGFLEENPLTLVKFFAPWCGHCKALAPHYETASEKVPDGIKLAEVDVTEEESLGSRFEIRGYPTLKFFRDGVAEEYSGGRTSETIVEWIESMVADAVTKMDSVAKAREEYANSVLFVCTAAEGSTDLETFTKIADSNRLMGRFIHVTGDDTTLNSTDLAVFRPDESTASSIALSKEFDEIVAFMASEKLPYFGAINGENFASYMETGLDFIWYAGSEKDMQKVSKELTETAKKYRGEFNFVWLDAVEYEQQASGMLGISDFPSIVRTLDGPGRFVFDGEMTNSGVSAWVDAMKEGKIDVSLKSEPIPDSNNEPVKVVVGDNFSEMITDDKDVLLEIYAPWCGHCKKLAPTWDSVAEQMAKLSPDVLIAKLDGTANEISVEGYEYQGFPTLYWKKAGAKPVAYQGGRDESAFLSFLSENATKPFTWPIGGEDGKDEL